MFVYCFMKVVVPQTTAQIRKQDNVQAARAVAAATMLSRSGCTMQGHFISVLPKMEEGKQLSKCQSFRL